MLQTHGSTVQVPDFISWVVPKYLSSKSFIHSFLYLHVFIFACWFFFSFSIALFLSYWNDFLYEERYQFPSTEVLVVTELCIPSWKPLHCWHTVTCSLTDIPKFYRKCQFCGVPSRPWRPLPPPVWYVSEWGTNSWGKSSLSVRSIKLSIMLLTGKNANSFQPVEIRLSISYFIFHSIIALQSINYMTKIFVAKTLWQRCLQ